MTEKYIPYKLDGETYNIPESLSSRFENDYPTATIEMHIDNDVYDIPLSKKSEVLKDYPNAVFTFGETDDNLNDEVNGLNGAITPTETLKSSNVIGNEKEDRTTIFETIGKGLGAAGVGTAKLALDLGQNLWQQTLGRLDDQTLDETIQNEDNAVTRASMKLGELQERLSREADPTGGEVGFGQLLKEGKIGMAAQKALGSGLESLPMMVAAGTGWGALLYGTAMAAGQYADETRENDDIPAWKRGINSIGSAALEMAVEKIGGPLKNLGGKAGKEFSEEMAKEIMEEFAKEGTEKVAKRIFNTLKKPLKEGLEEGGEELLTSFGNDALGSALDMIDGDKDYGIHAQWEQMKEENPDADLGDFAKSKANEYFDAFLGGALSGMEIAGTTDAIKLGVSKSQKNQVQDAKVMGSGLGLQDMYDVDHQIVDSGNEVEKAFLDGEGKPMLSRDFIDSLNSEQAYDLSRNEDMTPYQRKALLWHAKSKAIQEGLTEKMDAELNNRINTQNNIITEAQSDGIVVTGFYNGQPVYVKGAVAKNGSVSLPDGENGPVVVINPITGEKATVRTEDITMSNSVSADEYRALIENQLRNNDSHNREMWRNNMSKSAKAKDVLQYLNTRITINSSNGPTQVEVLSIDPQTGVVLIKGKKGDLGQSELQLDADLFYDSIARNEDGTPVYLEKLPQKEQAPEAPAAETTPEPQPEQPVIPEGPQDFREYVGPMVINGVPVNVEVTQQDDSADRVDYTFVDENGVRRSGSTTVAGFAEAVQKAGQLQTEAPVVEIPPTENAPTENVVPEPAPAETPAPQNVTLKPEDIDWDALFDTDQETFFAEMQNQFGDKSERYFKAFLAAAQKELEKLDKSNPTQLKDIVANEARKDALQARIDTLNGMISRLTAAPAPEVAPTTTAAPVASAPVQTDGNIPDVSVDKAADARARGFRMTNGQRVDRRGETIGVYGNYTDVTFTADSKGKRTGRVKIIDASSLVPSHIGGVENVEHFLPEAQPKKRTDAASTVSATLIAQNMDNPKMTNVASSAYEGAPIVNKRGEVIQGNNRSAAILEMYQTQQQKAAEYKQYLIDHAAEFGLNAEEVAAMQNPVLVRELDVDDADAITLGQYTMQDMESGGSQMIDSGRAIAGLSNKGLLEDFITRLLAEENEETSDMNLSDLITRNGNEALKMLYQNGIINQTQYQSALGANGRITADARASLRGIIEQQLFAGGIDNLSVMFEVLPDKAKKAIMQTISRDVKNPDDAKVTPYLQEAIEIYYQLNQQPDFVAAKTKEEVDNAVELFKGQTSLDEAGTPAEKYSNFAFDLAKKFKTLTLKQQRDLLNHLYEVIAGEANIFGESEGKPLSEAVAEVYGTNLNKGNNETNGQSGAAVLEGGNGGSQEGQQGSTGNVGVRPETGESGQGTTNGGANPTVGGSAQTTGEVTPVAPNPVANPVDAAKAKERHLKNLLLRYDLSPEHKYDLAVQIGKEIGDFFATIEEYESFEENATDFGAEYNKAVREGVDKSFAERQQNTGNSQENGVTLETEPKQGDNGTETGTETPEDTEGYNGTTGGQHTDDEGGKEGTQETEGLRRGDVNQEIKYPAREGDATRQLLMDTFGFASVSPGVSQENLNHIYDFLMEMSKMLGISPTSISHGATLGMGVLGEGRIGTLAAYQYRASWDGTIKEPYLRFKNSLLSSIAHEWWHSLDQALSYYETGRGKKPSTTASADEFTGRPEVLEAVRDILKAINKSGHKARLDSELKYNPEHLSYSKRKKELAARFFEGYIKSKFAEAGIVVNGFSTTQENTPTEEEVKPVIPAFDRLFKVLKEKEGKKEGSTILYHIGQEVDQIENEKRVSEEANQLATETALTLLKDNNIEAEIVSDEKAQDVYDAKISDRIDFYQTPDGTIYGWTDGKKIYLTNAGINPNTPIHEYTHLWANAMMQKNPKGWNSIKQLLKNTPVWKQVMNDANYSNIHGNEDMVASEVISRLSGTKNAAKLEQMAQQMIDEAKGTMRKAEARGLIQNIKDALNKFWSWVGKNLFEIENFNSIDEITDRVLWDLVNRTDLGELREGKTELQIAGEKGAHNLDIEESEEGVAYRMNALELAEQLESEGFDKKQIKIATGWEKGYDGKWRYEIDDLIIKDDIKLKKGMTLGDIAEKNDLFKAYPFLGDIKVRKMTTKEIMETDADGAYIEDDNTIIVRIKNDEGIIGIDEWEVLVHEVQHAIQHYEGFTTGASESFVRRNAREILREEEKKAKPLYDRMQERTGQIADEMREEVYAQLPKRMSKRDKEIALAKAVDKAKFSDKTFESIRQQWLPYAKRIQTLKILTGDPFYRNRLEDPMVIWDLYKSYAGEVEARNAVNRMYLSDYERAEKTLEETEGTPRELQIAIGETSGIAEARKKSYGKHNKYGQKDNYTPSFLDDIYHRVLSKHYFEKDASPYVFMDGYFMQIDVPDTEHMRHYRNVEKTDGYGIRFGIFVGDITEKEFDKIIESYERGLLRTPKSFGELLETYRKYTADGINSDNVVIENRASSVNNDGLHRQTQKQSANRGTFVRRSYSYLRTSEINSLTSPISQLRGEEIQNAAVDYLVGEPRLRAIENAVNNEASKLGVKVTYKTREEMPAGHKNDKGYYNTTTGEIVICTENASSIADAIQTILHEAVAHKGLRQLMGDKFNEFINRVYNSLDAETKAKVDALAAEQHDGNTAVAMEEYMASLAETENFAENSVWDTIKSIFEKVINAILGRNDIKIGDNELRYILRASYYNMTNPRNMETIRGWAQDQMMREEYKINETNTPELLSRTGIDPTQISRETAAQTYNRVVSQQLQEFQRQFQDAFQPVRIAIDAIQQETGNIPIEDYENYLLIQNQMSSRSRVEIDNFARRYYTPIINQVNAIIDKIMESRGLRKSDEAARAEIYKEVRQYLIAKHGFERNKYYQEHKTRTMTKDEMKPLLDEAARDYQTEVNMINMNNNLTEAERELQLRDALDVYNATVQEIKTREVPYLRDYSGLTSLFGLDGKEWEKAEEMAQELVDDFENSLGRENNEDGEMITQSEEIDALWKRINAATNKTLRHSYESGMLSRQQYNEIKEMFKFYIPLRGFDETTAEDVYSYARFEGNRFNAAVHKAEGRTSVADDPLAIIMNMAESEIAQGNKNRAKQALYNYLLNRASAMNDQNSLMQLEDVWYIIDVDKDGNKTYQIVTPDHASGETYEEFENMMQALAEEGRAEKSRKGKLDIGYRFQKQDNRNAHYVFVKINGVEKAIYINGDPKAADAINGRYQKELGSGVKLFRDIQRIISSTFTNYSLEFTARNYFRDMIYSHINIGVRESDPAYRKKFRQNWRHNNMGAMMRMLKAYRAGEYDGVALTEDEAAFVEFMENGGQTGYTLINSVEAHKKDLQRAIKRMQSGIEKGGVKDSTIFKATLGSIELLNEASELVTRFAAYKTSRDMGRGINSSIKDAKEVTVNFNTKGAQDGQGWMGAVARYFGWSKFFFNASVQGVQNLKSMRDANKLKFGTVVGGVVATGFFMPILVSVVSELLGGDDEEEYWNIPEYERQNNFCIPLGNGKYAKVPLPIGFREVYAIGDMVAASLMDKRFNRNAGEVGMDIANKIASVVLPVNPLESMSTGLNMWQTFLYTGLPSSAQVLIQNATNTDWKGTPLQKEYTYNENDPKWMKAFASNPDWMKGLSKWCNEHINLDGDYKGMDWSPEKLENTLSNLGGGIYSLIKKSGKTLSMIWNEENRNLSNVPLAGVVLGSGVDSDDRFVTDAYFDMKDFYDANLNYIKRRAEQFGYDLEDVFLKEKGKHQPKMLDIYQNRNFDFMQEWYKGNKELEEMNREIKKLKKEIAAKEKPSTALLNKLAKKQDKFNAERSDFVNDMLELD